MSHHTTSIAISALVRIATPTLILLLSAAFASSAAAQPSPEPSAHPAAHPEATNAAAPDGEVTPVDARFVCMITNKVIAEEQIRVPLNGRTYYGCCEMCVAKMNDREESRYAADPVTGNRVNKADAVIGAVESRTVFYFQSTRMLDAFHAVLAPEWCTITSSNV